MPFCGICDAIRDERPRFKSAVGVLVFDTLKRKGHRQRLMSVTANHGGENKPTEELMNALEVVGLEVFTYTPKFVILSPKMATITDHNHLIATDLDPASDDFQQILRTPWLRVVDVQ